MQLAYIQKHRDIMKMLLKYSADVTATDKVSADLIDGPIGKT